MTLEQIRAMIQGVVDQFVSEGRHEGQASETSRLIITALNARGISPSLALRQKIERAQRFEDIAALEEMIQKAIVASSSSEIFEARTEGERRHVQGYEEGLLETAEQAIRHVLEDRGLVLSQQQKQKLADCKDLSLLEQWFKKAVVVTSTDQIFRDG